MKTLAEVEPRLAINAANALGDSANTYIISSPGSYYLTGNLTGESGKNGILISSNEVTIDLNGFAILCGVVTQNGSSGIIDSGSHRDLIIRNGTIRGWGAGNVTLTSTNVELRSLRLVGGLGDGGVNPGSGCDGIGASNLLVIDCMATNNAGDGFNVGPHSSLTNCVARANTQSGFVGINTNFTNCAADSNADGYVTSGSCTFSHCSAVSASNQGGGFVLGQYSIATDCLASGNRGIGFLDNGGSQFKNCVSDGNGTGIEAGDGTSVIGCTAFGNSSAGIKFRGDCLIMNNNASANGANGFQSLGSLNRIEGNTAIQNTGDGFLWGNDYLVRNTAFGNTVANYSPVPGTGNSGPVQAASSATNPFANF